MELWERILFVFSQESVYKVPICLIGSTIVVLDSKGKRPIEYFLIFLISITISLTATTPLFNLSWIKNNGLQEFKPLGYLIMSLSAFPLYLLLKSMLKAMLSKEFRRMLIDKLIQTLSNLR